MSRMLICGLMSVVLVKLRIESVLMLCPLISHPAAVVQLLLELLMKTLVKV